MWVPRDVEEIEAAIARGDLEETSSFDGKADLPATPKKNIDLAVDIAAMSTEGGTLLYGVDEDEHKRLTKRSPIVLAGADERIAQIVQTSITEVPHIECRPFRLPDHPSRGYLLVIVPPSPRAPHQVTVRDDRRFYGRGATGNRRLSEQEVALLYTRRSQVSHGIDRLLADVVTDPRIAPSDTDHGALYAVARPVMADSEFWEKAAAELGNEGALKDALEHVARSAAPRGGEGNSFAEYSYWYPLGADGWRLTNLRTDPPPPAALPFLLDIAFHQDGSSDMYSGRVAGHTNSGSPKWIWERGTARTATIYLKILDALFRQAGYHGAVDIGIQAINLQDGISAARYGGGGYPYYDDSETFNASTYKGTQRLATAAELNDAEGIVRRLFARMFRATTGREDFDPFV